MRKPQFSRTLRVRSFLRLLVPFLLLTQAVFGADAKPEEVEAIRALLGATQPNMAVGEIKPSPIDGLYEVVIQGGQTIYVSRDAKYLIPGDLYKSEDEGIVNLGDLRRNDLRREKIAALDEKDMIVFEAEGERKATLTVFTDVDCPYCRKLHGEVEELNHMGIAVRYLAFPRTGLNTETHHKMIATWCAEDPKVMMTSAKRGADIPAADCALKDKIEEQYRLGREVGVTGTPALVLEDGTLLPGYVPAQTLSQALLNQDAAE